MTALFRLDGNTVHFDDPAAIVRHLQDNDMPAGDRRMFAAMLLADARRRTPRMLEGVTVDTFLARIMRAA